MGALSFASLPLFYAAIALMAVPIIIHLLFRRRFLRVDWAPMKYLKLTLQRNRRRMQLEQLILLLCRMLILFFLFCAVAQPRLQEGHLARLFGFSDRTSYYFLLDNSLSMGYQESGRTALQRGQEVIGRLCEDLREQDRLSILLASRPEAPLALEIEGRDWESAMGPLLQAQETGLFLSWPDTLSALDRLVARSPYPRPEVILVTDLRRAGWQDRELTALADRWQNAGVKLRILDVGSDRSENIVLADLTTVTRAPLVGTPTEFEATLRNDSPSTVEELVGTLFVDGSPTPTTLTALAPGQEVKVRFTAEFQQAGLHHVALRLPNDSLPGDNQRWQVSPVTESIRMVLVDGEPSSEPFAGEVDFLALALSVGVGQADGWRIEILADVGLSNSTAVNWDEVDLLVLANVANVSTNVAQAITREVRDGMGLMIFAGEQVDPDNYNRLFYENGQGVLPLPLEMVQEEEVSGILVEDIPDSPLAALGAISASVLERIQVKKYLRVQTSATNTTTNKPTVKVTPAVANQARILARWNNADAAPAVLERRFGAGRVVLWTITADKAWSDLPSTDPSYVLAVREAAASIVRTDAAKRDLPAGQPLQWPVDASQEIQSPVLKVPGIAEPVTVTLRQSRLPDPNTENGAKEFSSASASDAGQRFLTTSETQQLGVYELTWQQGDVQRELFAVNPDLRESNLTKIPPAELALLFGRLPVEIIDAVDTDGKSMTSRPREIWRSLVLILLIFVHFESVFALWVGRPR